MPNGYNPYYTKRGPGWGPGLLGLGGLFVEATESREERGKEEEFEASKEEAIKAYQSNDPDLIAETILQNPQIGKSLGELYDKRREYSKEEYASSLEELLTELETTGKVSPSKRPSISERSISTLQGDIKSPSRKVDKIDVIRSVLNKDPKAGKQMLQYELAKTDPAKFKAWQSVYGKDKATKYAPSNLKKMMNEKNKLIEAGADPKGKEVKAFDRLIFGNKEFAPTALKKHMIERQQYIDETYGDKPMPAEGDPNIDAYDQEITGIDVDVAKLTNDEIDVISGIYLATGRMPSLGRGREATKVRLDIIKRAAAQSLGGNEFLKPGMTPSEAALEVVATQTDTKSIAGGINFLEKQTASMGSFVQNLDEQITRVSEIAEDLYSSDVRLLNVPIRLFRSKIAGSPNQARYDLYITEIEREIAKLSQGATQSIAAMSVEEVKKWEKIHDKNLSIPDMLEVLKETRTAANMRQKSVLDQLNRTRERMRTRDYSNINRQDADLPLVSSQAEYNVLPSGSTYTNKNTGKQGRKP